MSTKIYEAYEYKGKDIESLMKTLKNMRARIWEEVVTHVGKYRQAGEPHYKFGDRIKAEMLSSVRGPLNCLTSAVVYAHQGKLYVHFFGLDDRTVFVNGSKFISKKLFKDCSYWNNTDSADGVSKKDWEARGRTWDGILGKSFVPSHAGLTYNFVEVGDAWRLAFSLEQRAAKAKGVVV